MGKYHMTITESQKRCDSSHRMVMSWSCHNEVTSHSHMETVEDKGA